MIYDARLDEIIEATTREEPLLTTPEVYNLLERTPGRRRDLRFTPKRRPESLVPAHPSRIGIPGLRYRYAKTLLSALYASLYSNRSRILDALFSYGRAGKFSNHLAEDDFDERHAWMYRAMTTRIKAAGISRIIGNREDEIYSLTYAFDNGSRLFIAMIKGEAPDYIAQHLDITVMRGRVIDLLRSAGLAISSVQNPPGSIVDLFKKIKDEVVQSIQ